MSVFLGLATRLELCSDDRKRTLISFSDTFYLYICIIQALYHSVATDIILIPDLIYSNHSCSDHRKCPLVFIQYIFHTEIRLIKNRAILFPQRYDIQTEVKCVFSVPCYEMRLAYSVYISIWMKFKCLFCCLLRSIWVYHVYWLNKQNSYFCCRYNPPFGCHIYVNLRNKTTSSLSSNWYQKSVKCMKNR